MASMNAISGAAKQSTIVNLQSMCKLPCHRAFSANNYGNYEQKGSQAEELSDAWLLRCIEQPLEEIKATIAQLA